MAKRTLADLRADVRSVLQDEDTGDYRYSDDELLQGLNSALERLRSLRPDAFIGRLREPIPHYSAGLEDWVTEEFPVDDIFFTPCTNYVIGWCELRDDQFSVDGRAVALLGMFQSALQGSG